MMSSIEEELDVEETELTDDDEPQDIRYEILSYPTDFSVRVMYEKWQAGQLVIPSYQRRYVWNLPQASRLIESFLLGLPIPQVFLFRGHLGPELQVVDGHQRLATIAHFYRGRFSDNREFRLQGVGRSWNGKSYLELTDDDRETLDDAPLRSIVIRQIQPDDSASIYQIFERLNTGGTQLNAMEIRRAIFRGSANALLDHLNGDSNWRALIGMPNLDPRFKDIEILLRVLALSERWQSYAKPMKKFITNYMGYLDNADTSKTENVKQRFSKACELVKAGLGDRPFHLRQRINLAMLDTFMACAVALTDTVGPIVIKSAYDDLVKDEKFLESVTYNTSDTVSVQQRFALTQSALTN